MISELIPNLEKLEILFLEKLQILQILFLEKLEILQILFLEKLEKLEKLEILFLEKLEMISELIPNHCGLDSGPCPHRPPRPPGAKVVKIFKQMTDSNLKEKRMNNILIDYP
jgi:hypothetical protein